MKQDKVVSEVLGAEAVLSPGDVYSKQFRRVVFGGYQSQDVDAYLERVADALQALIRQVRELQQQQEEYKERIEECRQMEETLRSALVASQKFGEDAVAMARREAETILEAARLEKERLLNQAARLPAALAQEISRLQQQRDRLRQELLGMLATHRAMLESVTPAEDILGLNRCGDGAGSVYFAAETDPGTERRTAGDFVPITEERSESDGENAP